MPEVNNHNENPWYRKSGSWAWITIGVLPEEAKKMDIGGHIDGPGDWKPDPNAAKRTKEFIEKGGNADPALDAIQDGDYHDLLDQNGGPEGF